MAKRKQCPKCGKTRALSAFEPNDKLEGGRLPWCKECVALAAFGGKDAAEYGRAYQQSYQAEYRKRHGSSVRRARGLARLASKRVLPKVLTVAALRRSEMQVALGGMWHALRETKTWKEFESSVCHHLGARSGTLVRRMLPIELYPEFALVKGNCVVKQARCLVTLHAGSSELGLKRLAKCILEVGYHEG